VSTGKRKENNLESADVCSVPSSTSTVLSCPQLQQDCYRIISTEKRAHNK